MNYNNIMIDIETLGVEPNSCILSIAAVYFDPETGSIGDCFHEYIDLQSCLDSGMIINANTFIFWMGQNEEARSQFYLCKGKHIAEALALLFDFLKNKENIIWANSPSFDLVILKSAYKKLNLNVRWEFYKERDLRTLKEILPISYMDKWRLNETQNGNHNALNDCYYQIKLLSAIYNQHILK